MAGQAGILALALPGSTQEHRRRMATKKRVCADTLRTRKADARVHAAASRKARHHRVAEASERDRVGTAHADLRRRPQCNMMLSVDADCPGGPPSASFQ